MSLFTWLFGSKPKVEIKNPHPVRKVTMMGSNIKSSSYGVSRKYESIDTNDNIISNIMNLGSLIDVMSNNNTSNDTESTKGFEDGFGGGGFSGGGASGNWDESPTNTSPSQDYSSNDYSSTSYSSSDYSSNSSSDSTSYSSDSSSSDY